MKHSSKGNFTVYEESDICSLDEYSETLGEELEDKLEEVEQEIEESAYDDTEIKADIVSLQEENETLQTENARLKATLPTTTGTGSNITLSKTAELEFIQPPLPRGNSEQVQLTGSNKFNKNTTIVGSYNCTYTFNDGVYTITSINTQNNFSFTLKLDLSTGSYTLNSTKATSDSTMLYNSQNEMLVNLSNNHNYYNFSIAENSTSIRFNFAATSQPVTLDLNSLQIVSGTYTSSTMPAYEPYVGGTASPNPSYPQEITNVTGDVEVLVQNKNIADINQIQIGKNWNNVNSPTRASILNIPVTEGEQYTLVSEFTNSNITQIRAVLKNASAFTGTYTIPTGNNSLSIEVVASATITEEMLSGVKIMLCKGIDTTYTPHKEQTLPLTLGNIELCKIGDYQDYIYKDDGKWYLHKKIGKVVLNGNENNWSKSGNTTFDRFIIGTNIGGIVAQGGYSNYFKVANINVSDNLYEVSNNNNSQLVFNYSIYGNTTLEQFKTWLSTHNTEVYYVLDTPTITEITDTTLINQLEAISQAISYEEQTNISGSSDESNPLFSVEAYQSTKLVLEEISNAVVALGGV